MKLKNLLPFAKKEKENYFERIPYSIQNHASLTKKTDVAVVVPVYNADKFLKQTVDSVIVQTLGLQNITLILVDDGSKDKSKYIMKRYSELYPNIVSIFLEENTGSPAFPRNLGAHLANSEYIMFLDADDWLDHDGLRQLYSLMEETGCDYAVGKAVEVSAKGEKVIGRYESCKVRKNVSPYSIEHLFYHLGPRARMMRLSFIKKHHILFPELKYSEDKMFFIDVLTKVGKISTTTEVIYFLNRIPENNASLIMQTSVMEKMDTNITALKYVMDKNLPVEEEIMIVNRIIEFDSIARLFDRKHFTRSEDRDQYFEKLEKLLKVFYSYNRSYQIEDMIKKPINKLYFTYFVQKEYDSIIKLSKWSKFKGTRSYQVIDGLPYTVAHLDGGKKVEIPIQVQARLVSEKKKKGSVMFTIELSGHNISEIQGVNFQHRDYIAATYDVSHAIEQEKGVLTVTLTSDDMEKMEEGKYILSLRYKDYEKLTVAKDAESVCSIKDRQKTYEFYRTVNGNLSFQIIGNK